MAFGIARCPVDDVKDPLLTGRLAGEYLGSFALARGIPCRVGCRKLGRLRVACGDLEAQPVAVIVMAVQAARRIGRDVTVAGQLGADSVQRCPVLDPPDHFARGGAGHRGRRQSGVIDRPDLDGGVVG